MTVKAPSTEMPVTLALPLGLQASLDWIDMLVPDTVLEIQVPGNYEDLAIAAAQPEVVAIQRILSLVQRGAKFRVVWDAEIARKILSSASLYPLLSVVLSLDSAQHEFPPEFRIDTARLKVVKKTILKHRFSRDLFSDSEVVICKDDTEFRPVDLYSTKSLHLRPREDFETLLVDALVAQSMSGTQAERLYKSASALGVVVAELFENTDMHGRLDTTGRPLSSDSLRGVFFKRIHIELPVVRPKPMESKTRKVDCFEVSVFDSGVGYFSSFTKGGTLADVTLEEEWKVLHNCLERHYYPSIVDNRSGHRAMGLFEVLRAIQSLKARIEFRTGRLYAYRTFLDGELQAQMRPKADFAHLAWPEPRLLDVGRKYVATPSGHEPLIGASVRIIVPLN